jgi:hypothetical protein
MTQRLYNCDSEKIAAYVEGDLETAAAAAVEEHLVECKACKAELHSQKLFMSELQATLAPATELSIPTNFAQVVAAHAESDMRGVRNAAEHKKALSFIVILAVFAFAFLGTSAGELIIGGGRVLVTRISGLFSFIWTTIYGTAASLATIAKVFSRGFVNEPVSLALLTLLFAAVLLLSRLIASYHRASSTE